MSNTEEQVKVVESVLDELRKELRAVDAARHQFIHNLNKRIGALELDKIEGTEDQDEEDSVIYQINDLLCDFASEANLSWDGSFNEGDSPEFWENSNC